MTLVLCDRVKRVNLLLDNARHIPSLKIIVVIDHITKELKAKAAEVDVKLVAFADAVVRDTRESRQCHSAHVS